MNKLKLTVVQSNATTKETFITKMAGSKIVDLGPVLGKKEQKMTYYISTKQQAKEGDIVELDLDMFNVVERPYHIEEKDETAMCKWLHLK